MVMGEAAGHPVSYPTRHHHPTSTMTNKQIRDLEAFAVELVKEGRKDAAKEVLALIARG